MSDDIKAKQNDVKLYATQAQQADKNEEYPKSVRMWENAIKTLNQLIRIDPNKYNVDAYKKKVEEYTEIMEKVKKKKVAEPEGGKKDSEDDKLQKQLSGTLITETPNVKWEDVAGLEKAKEALKEAVVLPIKFPQLFQEKRKPWKGILLYGPPGTGKFSAANIVSKWMGESEKLIKGLFDLARQNKPAVIFLDEIDSVLSARSDSENDATRRLKTEFLIQMQGVGNDDEGVLVLGATNIPWGLDPAVRRRFQKKIYISLPDVKARRLMFTLNLGDTENDITDKEFDILAEMTEGYSGSDIATLTQDAIYGPLRKCQRAKFFKNIDSQHIVPCSPSDQGAFRMTMSEIEKPESLVPPKVTFEDYIQSIQKIKATVNQKDLEKQEEFTREFGQEG